MKGLESARILLAVALLLTAPPGQPQDRLAKQWEEFDKEPDPVRKARRLARLGDAHLAQVLEKTQQKGYAAALQLLERYRLAVRTAHEALKASGRNAEKSPSGFKQLQIHLRKAVLQLNDTILAVPPEGREPFEEIRAELEAINKQLLDMLFPRQPGRKPVSAKPKGKAS